MTFTLTFGWWLAPLLVSLFTMAWALFPRESEKPTGAMFDWHFLPGLVRLFGAALPLSLASWLIWSLAR